MGRKKRKKKPSHREIPGTGKNPRVQEPVDLLTESKVSWHLRIIDTAGEWGCKEIDKITLWKDIHAKLSEFEKKTWKEILVKERTKNHLISVADICKEAQKRLKDIRQDDVDELVSLRLSGKKRIWGIKDRNILRILWWDPKHTVYPTRKKHT